MYVSQSISTHPYMRIISLMSYGFNDPWSRPKAGVFFTITDGGALLTY